VSALFPRTAYPHPTYIAADLAATPLMEALALPSFDRSKKTLFTIEGLVSWQFEFPLLLLMHSGYRTQQRFSWPPLKMYYLSFINAF